MTNLESAAGPAEVIVIGAGIAGLAAAWRVHQLRPEARVTVLESASSVGGKLRSEQLAGTTVDVGAEAMLARRSEGLELLTAAGLRAARVDPRTTQAGIWAGGALHPMPARTLLGIPGDPAAVAASGLLGRHSLQALAGERALPPLPPLDGDVAVGALVRSRLGDEVLDRLVEPLLGGVYAGRADRLSVRATMPALAEALTSGGSLTAAVSQIADTGARARSSGPVFTSLRGGLATLPARLAAADWLTVRTRVTARSVNREALGFRVAYGAVRDAHSFDADAVIVAIPAAKAARVLAEVAPPAAAELARIESASVAIVSLALRAAQLPAGSGLLVGTREGLAVKGLTVSSQKWPLDSGEFTLLRASLGRVGEPWVLQRDDAELIAITRRDLATLGIDGTLADSVVTRWGGALPQYDVGHVARVVRIRSAVAAVPALGVCGAAFDGVGIPACIASARAAVDQALAGLPARS